jgi:hypothetical protein
MNETRKTFTVPPGYEAVRDAAATPSIDSLEEFARSTSAFGYAKDNEAIRQFLTKAREHFSTPDAAQSPPIHCGKQGGNCQCTSIAECINASTTA